MQRAVFLLIIFIAFAVGFNGCAARRKTTNARQKRKSAPTFFQSQQAELAALARPPVLTTIASRQEPNRMGKDNSTVETLFDSFGNKAETRVFYEDALLKMVVLQTSLDGQKQALVYGTNGDVKTAPPNLLDALLTSPPEDIAESVGITEGRQENFMLAQLQPVPEMSLAEDASALNLISPVISPVTGEEIKPPASIEAVEETSEKPSVEIAKEPSETPVAAPPPDKSVAQPSDAEAAALRLRSIVQMPKANRKKTPEQEQKPE